MAMPQVNPTVTAWGIWRISEPSRDRPRSVSRTPGQQHRQQQARQAVTGDSCRHQQDEGTRRPADLVAAAAQRRNQKAADDGGVKPALRRNAGGDGKRHGKGQGDDGHRQRRQQVLAELGKVIAFAEAGDQLGAEIRGCAGAVRHAGLSGRRNRH